MEHQNIENNTRFRDIRAQPIQQWSTAGRRLIIIIIIIIITIIIIIIIIIIIVVIIIKLIIIVSSMKNGRKKGTTSIIILEEIKIHLYMFVVKIILRRAFVLVGQLIGRVIIILIAIY